MRSLLNICMAILFLLWGAAGSGSAQDAPRGSREVYVSPAGSDSADGSRRAPVRTLRRALRMAGPGDVVRLAAGEYAGGVRTGCEGVQVVGPEDAVVRGPARGRAIQVLHAETALRGFTVEGADIGVWLDGVHEVVVEGLTLRDIGGEGLRIKNQSCHNTVRRCRFVRMGRTGFDVASGRKNGEGIYIGTAPEQRSRNPAPERPDRCTENLVEECAFATEAAEAVDIKEDSERNIVRRCTGEDSRDPDGAIFGARGDSNVFEECIARGGQGHGFRFGGDTVKKGHYGQPETRTYGVRNAMRSCRAEHNAGWGVVAMTGPQDIDGTNAFEGNGKGAVRLADDPPGEKREGVR